MKKINIAIDGKSGCGKSMLARSLADALGYIYIDSGAMYRAVTLFLLRQKVSTRDAEAIEQVLPQITISYLREDETYQTCLNKENVESEIRTMDVSENVSYVARIPAVRRALVKQQQALGEKKGVVMDGRDIGTVVFPEAELKLFLTAQLDVRVQRRLAELKSNGIETTSEAVRQNLIERDRIDSTRADSPLKKAADAIELENDYLSKEELLARALSLVKQWHLKNA